MQKSRRFFLGMAGSGAVMAALLVFVAGYQYGPRFTYDSVNYIYAGHALVEKGDFLRPFEQPYIEWPPLYPMLIALLDVLPGNLLLKILFTQALIIGITVALAIRLAYRLIKNALMFVIFCVATVFSTPLLVVNHFVWSESLFCLLAVIQLGLLLHYISHPQPLSLVDLLLAGMLLCLQRHVGVFFIIAASLIILLYPPEIPLAKRFWRGLVYGMVSLIPLALWWTRNYLVKGQVMNDYSETMFIVGVKDHFLAFHQVFTAWFLPNTLSVPLRMGLLYGVIIWLIIHYIRTQARSAVVPATAPDKQVPGSNITGLLAIFFLSYFLLTYAASFTVNEFIDDRILVPAYVPGILLFFRLLDQYTEHIQIAGLKKSIIYLCLLWMLYPITRTFHYVHLWHSQPVYLPVSQPVEERLRYLYQF